MKHHLLTAIIMALSLMPSISKAQEYDFSAVNDDGVTIYYNILSEEEKTCGVTENPSSQYSGDIVIPPVANGYKVTWIENEAFRYSNVKKVTIPNTVTFIGYAAFSDCTGLTSIIIPSSVTTIGQEAFYACSNLTSITIPSSVTTIGGGAFANSGLKNIVIEDSEKTLYYGGEYQFLYFPFNKCPIETLYIGRNTDFLGGREQSRFSESPNLTSITFGNKVTSLDSYSFAECENLESVTFGESLEVIGTAAFKNCKNLKSVTLPNSLKEIGFDAFSGCETLESASLGSSLESIQSMAFYDCKNLKSITIPNKVKEIGTAAFYGCTSLESVAFGNSVEVIWENTFSNCTSLATVDIPNSVKTIYRGAFSGCKGLEYVNTGNGLKAINDDEFSGCEKLKTLILGNSVEEIGSKAFYGCKSLQSLTIPKSVKSIAKDAFNYTSSLESITMEEGNQTYNSNGNCNAIIHTSTNTIILGCKNTTFPESVTSIGDNAFCGCSGLTSIILPASITNIGASAFSNCTGLITIYSEITDVSSCNISTSAFSGSENTTLYVPKGTLLSYRANPAWSVIKFIEELPDDTPDASFLISCSGKGSVSINGAPSITNKISAADINEGTDNTFTFTPKPGCRLDQVLLNGLDITANVENNTLTCTIPANSQMIVTFTSEQGDLNNDGTINISDVVAIVNKILGN